MTTQHVGEFFTIQGAAQKLGSTFWRVYGYIQRHHVPTIRVGKSLLVRLADLSGMEREEGSMRR